MNLDESVLKSPFQHLSSREKPRLYSHNPKMQKLLKNLTEVAATKSTVLLCGETGVGKGVLARYLHEQSSRKNHAFVHVHCGAIAENLVESELFGHERGAFTSAVKRKLGKFELAHKGTIFLDEVSTLTLSAQVKLLQVLQDGTFQRVGGEADIKVDLRIIAATNEDLEMLSNKSLFRKDLYYRLNVFPVHVPPLRQRPDDLESLILNFVEALNLDYGKKIVGIEKDCLHSLQCYDWPGNIRELQNLTERAYILETSSLLTKASFPEAMVGSPTRQPPLEFYSRMPLKDARHKIVENFEQHYLQEVLFSCQGKIHEAAQLAGVGVRQLNKLMTKYGLDKRNFKKPGSSAV